MEKYYTKEMYRCGKVNLKEILRKLKTIRKEIKIPINNGKSSLCPLWRCEDCKQMFPKLNKRSCPCDEYTKEHLIKRLNEIIKHFPRN